MTEIIIKNQEERDLGWDFLVSVEENSESIEFKVFVGKEYFRKLIGDRLSLKEFVIKSFNFLLERESKEMILREFDINQIQKYFPEFEEEILK